jgi:hypothetical protein
VYFLISQGLTGNYRSAPQTQADKVILGHGYNLFAFWFYHHSRQAMEECPELRSKSAALAPAPGSERQ